MAQAYEHLAEWFEYLNDDCDYASWSQYFMSRLEALGAGRKGAELGCGSGAFCRLLARAGYTMQGADISLPMLVKAEKLAREEGLRISFRQADALTFATEEKQDFILAPNDVYNYLPPRSLKTAFTRAGRSLKKGGIFWFDVSSPYKLREKVGDTVTADDRDEVTYLSFNRREGEKICMDVTLFVRRADGAFDRFDERHVQYIHEEAAVLQALDSAGFGVLFVEGHLGEEKEKSDRLNFICRKR